MSELENELAASRARIESYLDSLLPPVSEVPQELHGAMRYAALTPGKRLRPALAFATAQALDCDVDAVLPVAAAAELVHAYSLVHDDLPAMDDDAERRGQPTVHVKFGEANAILAGDALLALAFEVLASANAPSAVVARLAQVCGSRELVGGQADDLRIAGSRPDFDTLISIHQRKTAALFGFAVWGGGRLCAGDEAQLAAFDAFALHYGLAFQATDDLLDDDPGECSILSVRTSVEARAWAEEQARRAIAQIAPFGPAAGVLAGLAETVTGRLP